MMEEHEVRGAGDPAPLVDQEVVHVTSPLGIGTKLVDGIKGIAIVNDIVRISFTENVLDTLDEAGLKGRHVVTLAMGIAPFLAIMDLLEKVRSDVRHTPHG